MGTEPAILYRYVAQVVECITDFRPVVVYFYYMGVAQALHVICNTHGSKWEAYHIHWKEK